MGVFQHDLGVPGGYGEWMVGDEVQYKLADYHSGKTVDDFDGYEMDILESITNPDLNTIIRVEKSQYTGRTALALYVQKDQTKNRWGSSPLDLFSRN